MTLVASPRPDTGVDRRSPHARLACLLDDGSLVDLHDPDDSGVRVVRGTVDGHPVIAYCTDATRMGGALGADAAGHIVHGIDTAVAERCPVIGVWHSGGARLAEGVGSLHGMSRMFAAITRASGLVPQLSVVVGPAAGAAAYGSALTDVVVMADEGRIFVTGPQIVRSVTGEDTDMAALGGPKVHSDRSGVAHVVARDEADAYARARRICTLLAVPGHAGGDMLPEDASLAGCLPENPRQAYDVRPLVRRLLDPEPDPAAVFVELQPRWAPNLVIGLGRLAGRTVGVVANNPLRMGGCLDSLSAEKGARFVRMCDALGIPLVVLVDVPGYLPGARQEWDGVVRRGAKLLHAFAACVVPRVTLVLRKSYGGAYIAMNSRGLGASAVFAWPGAEVAVMGAESAVDLLHRRQLAAAPDDQRDALRARLTAEHERQSGGLDRARGLGVVDEVIAPEQTRQYLAKALAEVPAARGRHGNIPL